MSQTLWGRISRCSDAHIPCYVLLRFDKKFQDFTSKKKDHRKTLFLLYSHEHCREKSECYWKSHDAETKKSKTPINLLNITDLEHVKEPDDETYHNIKFLWILLEDCVIPWNNNLVFSIPSNCL